MVDITAKLFWYRSKEWYENMADKLNDIVYTDDAKETVNVINVLLLGWILLGLIVYIIGTVIATQLRKRKGTFSPSETEISSDGKSSESTEHVSCASETKSTAPEFFSEPEKLEKTYTIPTCNGDEQEIVDWINCVFSWIYKNRVISPVLDAWISALNARTRLLSTEHGILVEFKDVTLTPCPPDVQEATEICTSRGDLNIMCDMGVEDVNFDIAVTQVKDKDKTITPFSLNVRRIAGKVNVECVPEDLSFVAKYSEAPQVELSAETPPDVTESVENVEALNAVVCEICSEAFSSAIVDLKFSCYPECPRLTLKGTASEEEMFESAENETQQNLLVKIIKATNLGGTEGCVQPYCVIEMDEPPQKFETKALQEKSNPFWDESFTFTVKDVSAELLFELYDKGKPSKENFLGLGIVSVDELIRNPSQRQIIPLQSRPLEDDNVTGSLTTEFLFLNQITPVTEPSHLSQKTVASDGKMIETNSRVTAGGTVITTTTIKRTNEEGFRRPEALRNAIPFTAPIIKPVHENSEEQMRKKNDKIVLLHSDLNDSIKNDVSHKVNGIDTNCLNGHLLSNGNADINVVIQNGFVAVNAEADAKEDFAENKQNCSVSSEPLLSNGMPGLLCPLLHGYEKSDTNMKHDILKTYQNNSEVLLLSGMPNLACPSLHVHENLDANGTAEIKEITSEALVLNGVPNLACPSLLEHEKLDAISKQDSVEIKEINSEALVLNGLPNLACPSLLLQLEKSEAISKQDSIEIQGMQSEVFLSNGVSNLACTAVHAEQNNSISIDDKEHVKTEDGFNHIENKPILKINNDIKLHDIVKPLLLMNDSDHYDCDTLPTIVENVESSSASSKGLANDKDGEADLTGTALKEIEKHSKPNNSTSKSTLIIHSVQRADSSISESLEASPASHVSKDSRTSYSESVPSSPSQDRSGDDRSRSKEKKSLFGSLRRRLSFKKTRSKSAENRSESSNYSQGSSRSVSSDRLRSKTQKPSPLKGKFMGMKFLAVPGSTRSSLSEVSGISGSSSRTYINENSTLVVETNENGIIKRYLIPNSLIHRSKWKKRGIKLHIYNDHVFVAKHLSGSTECKVCQKFLTRRPGKQGYECRGCNLQCHKSCHVKVESYCSNSSINSMEVEYIHDPKGATPKSI